MFPLIWIIGGTKECVELVNIIQNKIEYVVTVATYSGKEMLGDANVMVGRLTKDEMRSFIKENKVDKVIDLSHPYALEVSNNAKEVSKSLKVPYIRYVRAKTEVEDAIYLESLEETLEYVKNIKGCVFVTTGIKSIKDFEAVRGENRFVYRVLPTTYSMEECVKNKVKMENIIAILGPVSKALNSSMFKEYNVEYVIMKDSGKQGGTPEKIEACQELGITPIIIGRKQEDGIWSMEELLEMIR